MQRRNEKGFTPKTATTFILNSGIFGEDFQDSFPGNLKEAVAEIIGQMTQQMLSSPDALTGAFVNLWNTKYSQYLVTNAEGSEGDESDGSEEETAQTEIEAFIKQNDLNIPAAIVPVFTQQYQTVLGWLKQGSVCVRWKLLNGNQQRVIKIRLLEGFCLIVEHLCSMHNIKQPAQLTACFQTSTIILHGSYLFGANNYQPADIDVIIIGECPCATAPLHGQLTRKIRGDYMTIGHQCNMIDVMVGIPLCTPTLLTPPPSWEEIAPLIREYLNTIDILSSDKGKEYRKLVNCALVLHYFLVQSQKPIDQGLQTIINQANQAIVGVLPTVSAEAIQQLLQTCNKVYKQIGK